MKRSFTCGELRLQYAGETVHLCGWIRRVRRLGSLLFVDLRDRYGVTQLVVDESQPELLTRCEALGREFVVRATGVVRERESKNMNIPTGEIEVLLSELSILNPSETPPFTIEENTDGGDDLRMKFRYLDLRRPPILKALTLRHRLAQEIRSFLNSKEFLEVETPFLIKSTPEGARDFVVPSRMHPGEFYALPQSPQTFKQLLMVGGIDRYYQIVRCFRDEDLRADRQPEFTQIDCEMSFVEREDVLALFEGMMRHLFDRVLDCRFENPFMRMPYDEAIARYGSDKPDLRVGMEIHDLTSLTRQTGFAVLDGAEYVGAIAVPGGRKYTRRQLDALTEFVKRPQIGAKGLLYLRMNDEGGFKSSADKFLSQELQAQLHGAMNAGEDDLLLIMSGERGFTLKALGSLRLEVAQREEWLDPNQFKPLWIVDFPLFEWDAEAQRFFAMHHPFTSPHPDDIPLFEKDPASMRANAYDLVVTGVELGSGSIRIHDRELQQRMFRALGFTPELAEQQFGFLMNAFRYGAPPHGGIAFGFDRICALFGGHDSIRDYIAFPKNNAGRDVMIESPSPIERAQLDELSLAIKRRE